jgi:hypothetical protein
MRGTQRFGHHWHPIFTKRRAALHQSLPIFHRPITRSENLPVSHLSLVVVLVTETKQSGSFDVSDHETAVALLRLVKAAPSVKELERSW